MEEEEEEETKTRDIPLYTEEYKQADNRKLSITSKIKTISQK